MATMDVFNSSAFSMASLTAAVERVPHRPSFLRRLGLFSPKPVRSTSIFIEDRNGVLTLVPTSPRGAPPAKRTTELRSARNFRALRLAKGDRINADEVQNIRAFGSESELMQVQAEVARRLGGPTGILGDIDLTEENLMLGAVQGIVIDADGTTTLYNYFTEFGVAQPTEIDFDLDNATPASGAVRKLCTQVVRAMQRAAVGCWIDGASYPLALCGDAFWDDLTAHSEVRQTYLNTMMAVDLREGLAFEMFRYGGIVWTNYRSTDDGGATPTVGIPTDKAKFVPVNCPGLFEIAYAPGETFEVVNTLGQPRYSMIVPDKDRQMWVDVEAYSYPLPYVTRPLMLQRARRT